MSAYVIVNIDVHDWDAYARDYGPLASESVARHGGRYLARGGRYEALEGDRFRPRVVVLEFDSYEAAEAWYRSDDYQAALKIRQLHSSGDLVIVDGVEAPTTLV